MLLILLGWNETFSLVYVCMCILCSITLWICRVNTSKSLFWIEQGNYSKVFLPMQVIILDSPHWFGSCLYLTWLQGMLKDLPWLKFCLIWKDKNFLIFPWWGEICFIKKIIDNCWIPGTMLKLISHLKELMLSVLKWLLMEGFTFLVPPDIHMCHCETSLDCDIWGVISAFFSIA